MKQILTNQKHYPHPVVTRDQYGISPLVSPTSLRGETSGGVAQCQLFSQANWQRANIILSNLSLVAKKAVLIHSFVHLFIYLFIYIYILPHKYSKFTPDFDSSLKECSDREN